MEPNDFIKHLGENGCVIVRKGSKHEIWENIESGAAVSVPRLNVLKKDTVRQACKELMISSPFN